VLALLDGFLQAEGIPGFPALRDVLANFNKEKLHE
jgi:hypothetical protein